MEKQCVHRDRSSRVPQHRWCSDCVGCGDTCALAGCWSRRSIPCVVRGAKPGPSTIVPVRLHDTSGTRVFAVAPPASRIVSASINEDCQRGEAWGPRAAGWLPARPPECGKPPGQQHNWTGGRQVRRRDGSTSCQQQPSPRGADQRRHPCTRFPMCRRGTSGMQAGPRCGRAAQTPDTTLIAVYEAVRQRSRSGAEQSRAGQRGCPVVD